MATFFIINETEDRSALTSVEFEKNDKKILIKDFLGYKITIEKIKGEEYGKKTTSKKESR